MTHGSDGTNFLTTRIGGKLVYGVDHTNGANIIHLLSRIEDPFGNATRFEYETGTSNSIRLKKVIDVDGLETTFEYTNSTTYFQLVRKVNGPFGLTTSIMYDEYSRLTNIVDSIGLTNSLVYETN